MEERDFKELAKQLSYPDGEKGLEVAELMSETNLSMSVSTIHSLNLINGDKILELGHASCSHLNHILIDNLEANYYGLELSISMMELAISNCQTYIDKGIASFYLGDGNVIPFEDDFFTKIMTVNTLYFWSDPVFYLNEIYRVLKKGGICCITFAQETFMKKLPFSAFGFELYDDKKIQKLVRNSKFSINSLINYTEEVSGKNGEKMERIYSVLVLKK